jgi:hypothetical protein
MGLIAQRDLDATGEYPDLLMERWFVHRSFECHVTAGWEFDFDNTK